MELEASEQRVTTHDAGVASKVLGESTRERRRGCPPDTLLHFIGPFVHFGGRAALFI